MSRKRTVSTRSQHEHGNKLIAANQAMRRRGRIGWIAPVVLMAILIGVALIMHFSSSESGSSATGVSVTHASNRMGTPYAVGLNAPNGTFTTTGGRLSSVSSLVGKPTLIWFVSTWCSSCQAGTQAMAANISKLSAEGVRVVEVELYKDLGQSGPSIATFGKTQAGSQYSNSDWVFAKSSQQLTRTYDPKSYLDIYYLLNSQGKIVYVNGSPASTMSSLLGQASRIS